jgi:excisionase family DNA binding protein
MPDSIPSLPRITTNDIAKMAGVHPVTVRRWTSEGRIEYSRIGGRIRFTNDQAQAIVRTVAAKSA